MNKEKLERLYMVVGQIQELLEDGYIHTAKEKIEELRIELQNQIY
jgi:ribosomal protein L17